MSMSEQAKKVEKVKSAYPGDRWVKRVEKMPEDQIDAIYLRLAARNQLNL